MTADPSGTREGVEAAIPRQRDAAGVMGYVAEIQQFDESMTAGSEETAGSDGPEPYEHPAEPEPDDHPPEEPPRRERPDAGAPAGVPASQAGPPWTRTEVGLAVAFVVVAAAAIIGGAYALIAANRPPTGERPLPLPTVGAAAPGLPGEPTPSGGVDGEAGPDAADPTPGASAGLGPAPRAGSGGPAAPAPEASSTAPVAQADLTAVYAREANTGLLGLTGYRGKVTVSNRGEGTATTWEVTLSLPAGQTVSSVEGAEFRQDGQVVTFTPTAATGEVGSGRSVEFTFDVPGLLAGEPTGCAVNGRPCD